MKSAVKFIVAHYELQGESYGWICTRLVLLLCKYNILQIIRLVLSSVVSRNVLTKESPTNGKQNRLCLKPIASNTVKI